MGDTGFNLDEIIDRRGSNSMQWSGCAEDVLVFKGAEMEFAPADVILEALRKRVEHRMLGSDLEPPELREVLVDRFKRLYGWELVPDDLVFLPGVEVGLYLACHSVASPGDDVLAMPPVYGPILDAPGNAGAACNKVPLIQDAAGRYEIDFDGMAAAITDRTRLFILCNPHNPVGRVYERRELERMAELCQRHDIVICSDEIYNDWVFDGRQHIPIASLSPEIGQRTITLFGTSKSHNIAGLRCGVAVVQNSDLRDRLLATEGGLVPPVRTMEYAAALAAYRDGGPWQEAVLRYLQSNRDFLVEYVETFLPGIQVVKPEGTMMAWLDCRQAGFGDSPLDFFLRSKVVVWEGEFYGRQGEGFVRMTFACPRSILAEALERVRAALLSQ